MDSTGCGLLLHVVAWSLSVGSERECAKLVERIEMPPPAVCVDSWQVNYSALKLA